MRWKCTCAYDGTEFCGWQSQANKQAIQDVLEAQIAQIFKRFVRIHGSSRTDAGVHARAQVFHFDADWIHGEDCLLKAINSRLPTSIKIVKVEAVDELFHARFSGKGKRYCYYFQLHPATPFNARYIWHVPNKNLDIECMQSAAKLFLGTHDFRGFAGKVLPGENTVKILSNIHIISGQDSFVLSISGSGYLYRMVRMIMGALTMCGMHKITPEFITERLALKQLQIPIVTAPPHGLFLEEIFYNPVSQKSSSRV